MRDRSEKPTDQCSDNEIGRGLVTNSPALGTRPKKYYEIRIRLLVSRKDKHDVEVTVPEERNIL